MHAFFYQAYGSSSHPYSKYLHPTSRPLVLAKTLYRGKMIATEGAREQGILKYN